MSSPVSVSPPPIARLEERISVLDLRADEARAIEAVTSSPAIAPPGETFLTCFERWAKGTPDAVAVRFGARQLTYAELDARASLLAGFLRTLFCSRTAPRAATGGGAERAVAVCLKPSLEVAIAIVAIFKAEGVYVPLDPSYPAALLASLLDEVQPLCVLTDGERAGAELPESVQLFRFDADWALVEARAVEVRGSAREQDQKGAGSEENEAIRGDAMQLTSHVFYTSGTTGKPKGVVATRENLAHFLRAARERYAFTKEDVFCSLARYTFSISLFELLSPLACGASLVLLARDEVLDPARLSLVLSQVTVVHAGPSLLTSLVRQLATRGAEAPTFPKLRHVSTGGDLVPPHLLAQLKKTFSASEIFVIYGCTEVSCMGATFEVTPDHKPKSCLVGKAFPGVTLRVLDARGNHAGFDSVGEIYFAGFGVAKHYLERPDLTSERFVAIDGQRFYRTGDLGRLQQDGNLEILGRSDFQVQVRGIRVELSGIEHTIRRLGLCEQCAVVALAHDENDVRLCAFVVGAPELGVSSFRKALARELPDYMVPQKLVVIEALPLTPNGKLDRRRLVELARDSYTKRGDEVAAQNELEQSIADAFARVLGVDAVSVTESFFDLGGHSLLAVMLMEDLKSRLGVTLSPELIFEYTSVRALAEIAQDATAHEQRPILLSQSAEHAPVFALLGVHLYKALARALEGKFSVYGVFAGQEMSLLGTGERTPSVPQLAQTYLSLIRRTQPDGPYRLIGMSFGGIVAYEVAQQLLAAGERVEVLGMLDSVLPETRFAKLQRVFGLSGRELVTELTERMRGRPRAHESAEPALFLRAGGDARLDRLEEQRQAAYRVAAHDYRRNVRPYPHSAFLVVSGKRLQLGRLQNPRCGFERLVRMLDVYTADTDHLGILEAPSVDRVAGLLLTHAACAKTSTAEARPSFG